MVLVASGAHSRFVRSWTPTAADLRRELRPSTLQAPFLPELPLDVLQKIAFDEQSGLVREFVQRLNDRLRRPLSLPDTADEHPDCAVDLDSHFLRYETRSGVIREEHGVGGGRKKSQASGLSRIKGEGLAESGQLYGRRRGLGHQGRERLRERPGAMLEDFVPDRIRYQERAEVREEVEAPELVEMDERPGVQTTSSVTPKAPLHVFLDKIRHHLGDPCLEETTNSFLHQLGLAREPTFGHEFAKTLMQLVRQIHLNRRHTKNYSEAATRGQDDWE